MTKQVLLINSDDLLRQTLAAQLKALDFQVVEAALVADLVAGTQSEGIDLVLIDAQSAGPGPAKSCQSLRAAGIDVPILILGAGPADCDTLLAAGASDCLAKPFRLASLAERLRTHLRDGQSVLPIGGLRFNPTARVMLGRSGRPIPLTEKETAILAYLHQAGERVVPRDELLGQVWGYSQSVSTHTVETHIYRLRRKLDEGAGDDAVLLTVDGGYRLAGAGPQAT